MRGLRRDIRNAWRQFAIHPGWTVVAALSLALGIGATTMVFSIVESVLLRPFPYPNPQEIVLVHGSRGPESAADLADYRDQSMTIAALGLYSGIRMRSPENEPPVRVAAVTSEVFRVIGVAPAIGSGPPPDRPTLPRGAAGTELVRAITDSGPNVVVLSHGYWQRRYAGDADVVGQTLRLDRIPHEIVGVMPRGFFFPEPGVEMWTPLGGVTATAADVAKPGPQAESVVEPFEEIQPAADRVDRHPRVARQIRACPPS